MSQCCIVTSVSLFSLCCTYCTRAVSERRLSLKQCLPAVKHTCNQVESSASLVYTSPASLERSTYTHKQFNCIIISVTYYRQAAVMWDAVIVGAGLAGLTAAGELLKRNPDLKVLVLEGKDRVGGRTVTLSLPAARGEDRWDLGGQWVGRTQTHVLELIQELGLETYSQYTSGKKVYQLGGPQASIRTYTSSIPPLSWLALVDMQLLLWKIEKLSKTVSVDNPGSAPRAAEFDSITLYSYISDHTWTQEVRDAMEVSCRSVFGVESSQLSFLYFLMYGAAAGGFLPLLEATAGSAQELKGGTQQLSERLADRVGRENIRLASAVTAVEQGSDSVEVRTVSGTFTCKAVIVTCPPHLAAKIHYQPPLPLEREHLTQYMPVAHMMKFIVTYPTAFWREKGYSGEVVTQPSSDCPFSVTFDATSPSGNPALVGFVAGVQATDWSNRPFEQRRDAVVQSLSRFLGPEASNYIHYAEKDWAKESFNGGCPVNIMVPGTITYFHPSLRKACGRIYWAGTETATQWCGYLSGAIQSGQRVAVEVLGSLSPESLTQEEQERHRTSTESPISNRDRGSAAGASCLNTCFLLTAICLGPAFLLAQPRRCQNLIGQGLSVLQKAVGKR
ncbi:probable flavin-containing monoamine oxidase A isoform X2 [Amia ocellicauda]|uniref:probable flavin-containing monoamine oxidase A isoform X2 n=1 Tax=Amia ocellicauda TaxID=2972642 RepID=UPI003463EDDA